MTPYWTGSKKRHKNQGGIIRFDCIASNEGLNHYYQKRYTLKEVAHIHGRHSKYEIVLKI